MSSKPGTVYLVGAGPGDPGLATVRAAELIARADVILYDRLVSSRLLDSAGAGTELVYVGKEAGGHTMTQDEINRLLVAHAKEGRTVVRLRAAIRSCSAVAQRRRRRSPTPACPSRSSPA
jgi:uroporphyrinogen III methyltransferase/synthase